MLLVAGKQDGHFYSKTAEIFLLFGWKFANFFPNWEKIIVGVSLFCLSTFSLRVATKLKH
jgi:hypothetical protein